jgi:hypothetical protein
VSTKTFEAFSISHAAILDGTTGADTLAWGDIFGVREGSLTLQEGSYDNSGDNRIMSSWFWFDYATVTVKSGYISFDQIANLMGSTVTSSGVAPNDVYSVPIWNQASINQLARPMLIRSPSKDSNGVLRTLDIVLYKVQFQPFRFEGPNYRAGLLCDYVGRALTHTTDETGASIAGDPAVGRLISRPQT